MNNIRFAKLLLGTISALLTIEMQKDADADAAAES
jgi:hypothetical protein